MVDVISQDKDLILVRAKLKPVPVGHCEVTTFILFSQILF